MANLLQSITTTIIRLQEGQTEKQDPSIFGVTSGDFVSGDETLLCVTYNCTRTRHKLESINRDSCKAKNNYFKSRLFRHALRNGSYISPCVTSYALFRRQPETSSEVKEI